MDTSNPSCIKIRMTSSSLPSYKDRVTLPKATFIGKTLFWVSTLYSIQDLSSPTRDQPHASCKWKHGVLTTGLPGKSKQGHSDLLGKGQSQHQKILFLLCNSHGLANVSVCRAPYLVLHVLFLFNSHHSGRQMVFIPILQMRITKLSKI